MGVRSGVGLLSLSTFRTRAMPYTTEPALELDLDRPDRRRGHRLQARRQRGDASSDGRLVRPGVLGDLERAGTRALCGSIPRSIDGTRDVEVTLDVFMP